MPEKGSYLTIAAPAEGLYKEKGSKFLAFAYPVRTENEIKSLLEDLKKAYFDARHHCYAYILGPDGQQYRANDAGEPNHSAGDPILGQIRSCQLTDVLVVVVRYFGGTKLGLSGLIQAYRTAASEALAASEIIEKTVQILFSLHFSYEAMNAVMKLVKEYELEITAQDFGNDCNIRVWVRQSIAEEVNHKLLQSGVKVEKIA